MSGPRLMLNTLVAELPKAELHVHLEGTLEPGMLFDLARRNRVDLPFESVEAVRLAYDFSRLQDFLDIYYAGTAVLQTERDFHELAMAYLRRACADNVRHVEAFFDPQAHTERGVAIETVMGGFLQAVDDASELGMSVYLIPCFLRHLPEEAALATFDGLRPYLDRLTGVGLDSSEVGHPPRNFQSVFEKARSAGLKAVAHAGEEGPPEYVREALQLLQVDRIDHGNRCMEDAQLVTELCVRAIPLTVCPLSNLRLAVVRDLKAHPLARMLQAGLKVTVNSDDPAYFGGYVNDNYVQVAEALGLSSKDIVTLARNSFEASFLPEVRKREYDAAVLHVARALGVVPSA
ncbi:MAG: adenosine deaminase [Woeseia sp.]